MLLTCYQCSDEIIVDDEEQARDAGWGQDELVTTQEKVWLCEECWNQNLEANEND